MTANNHQNDVVEVEERLFEEGVPSYRAAMVALREFRNIVHKKCRRVLTSRLDNFAQAIGLDLKRNPIQDYYTPGDPSWREWDGLWGWLGVRIELPNYGGAYFGLTWNMDEQELVNVNAMIKLLNRALFDRASHRLRITSPRIHEDAREWDVLLFEPMRADQLRDFEGSLTRVIDEWSSVWRDIGGLSVLNSA
jgi:hypothetical protein